MTDNLLYYGDNLDILRRYIKDESVDLIYLDPPFNSNATYNVLFAEQNGSRAAAQIKAFQDTWHWDQAAAGSYQEVVEAGGKVSQAMQAFRTLLGDNDMLAYLAMMAPRLVQLRRVLKSRGSIYLHCDPTAGHYLKVLMDAVFGPAHFRNEIVWRRTASHNQNRRCGPIHDVILFYAKTDDYYFRAQFRPVAEGHIESYFRKEDERGRYWTNALTGSGIRRGESGSPWRGFDPSAHGRHWAVPGDLVRSLAIPDDLGQHEKLDQLLQAGCIDLPTSTTALPTFRQYLADAPGIPLQDIWAYQPYTRGVLHGTDEAIDEDVRWIPKQASSERLGYQTQKPEGVLSRIVRMSCPEDGVTLDPFCGCGTTIAVAERFKRPWIGIDITQAAIRTIKERLAGMFGDQVTYRVIGEPVSMPDAEALAKQDPFQFQWWALGLVGARPVEGKRGSDKGIDGRLYFHDEAGGGKTKQVILSVKGGHTSPSDVRDLLGVLHRDEAQIGVLITMAEPTQPMRSEAASAGFYEPPGRPRALERYPRLQILTIADLLGGKGIAMPRGQVSATFKKAPKAKAQAPEQLALEE